MRSAEIADGLRLGLGTLTVLPVRAPRAVTPGTARVAVLAAPLLVLPVTVLAAALGWAGIALGLPAPAGGLLSVGALAWLTRGLHLDGLADTADGLASSWHDRERALAVMRSGTAGPAGVVTLVVVVGLQATCLGSILAQPWGWAAAAAALAGSRAALTLGALRGVPAARPDGLGAAFAGSVGRTGAVLAQVAVAVVLAGVQARAGHDWLFGLVAAGLGVVAPAALLARCVGRFGGITGDVLGALVEVAATALLLGSALAR